MPLVLKNTAAALTDTPDIGYSSLFPNENGQWGSKDATGAFRILGSDKVKEVNLSRIRRILPFGDSITQNSSTLNNGYWQAGNGYAENAIRRAARFTYLANAGVGGNTVAQMRARFATDVLPFQPEAILFMAGTNSITTGISFAGMADVLDDYEWIVQQSLANGIIPILVTPPAKTQAGLGQDNTGWSETRDFIPFLYDLAAYYGLPLIDVFKFTCDTATGGFRAGLSDDGVHPNQAGADAIAAYVSYFLQNPQLALNQVYLSSANEVADSGRLHNILQNGCFNFKVAEGYMGGWGEGSVGDNATVLVPGTADTALARSSGNLFKYTMAANGGAYALAGSVDPAAWVAGDVLEFSGRVTGPALNLATAGGLTVSIDVENPAGNGNVRPINADKTIRDVIFSQEFKVTPGTTSLSPTVYVQDAGLYTFNNFTVTNKTKRQSYWKPGVVQA
jgi:lysophospholipase L1-like esterase